MIRETWLSAEARPGPGLDFVFVVGQPPTEEGRMREEKGAHRAMAAESDRGGSSRRSLQGASVADSPVADMDILALKDEFDTYGDMAMLKTEEPTDKNLARNIQMVFQWAVHVSKQRYMFIAKVCEKV